MRNVPRLIQKAVEQRAVVLLHSRDILPYNLSRMIEYVFHSTLWGFPPKPRKKKLQLDGQTGHHNVKYPEDTRALK
jgi:hypothetical protein